MPRTMNLPTISGNLSNTSDLSISLPVCDNLTNFGQDVFAERTAEFLYNSNNATCLKHAPTLTQAVFLKVIVLAVISVLSLIGNLATIYSIIKNRRKNHGSTIYTLILHLSVADLLVSIFCLAGDAIWSYNVAWLWGNVACKIFKFLQVFSLYLSTFVLVLIGVDRFVAVRYPMKGLNSSQKCSRFVLLTWVLSFVLAIPQIVVFHVVQGPFVEVFMQCVTFGTYTEPWQEQLYAGLSVVFMFLLPLAILVTTYVSTVTTISRSQKEFKAGAKKVYARNSDLNRRRLMHRAKMKSLRLSVVIVTVFLIWWTPYYIMMIILLFINPNLSEDLKNGIFFFGMSNSLVNPLIYGAFHLWPQRQRQRDGSYQRSDVSIAQQRNASRRETKTLLLSHQDSGKITTTSQQHQK